MEGFRLHEWGADPVWEELPDPVAGAGEVLVEVEACGVGLTVLNTMRGDLANDVTLLPRVPGHELVGRVTAAGSGADPMLVGKRVVAYFYLVCESCEWCTVGLDPRCSNLAGWVGVHRDGGYAPLVALPEGNVIAIPEGIDPVEATVIPDAVATPVHVAARAGIESHDRVIVFGAGGGVGIHMIQVAAYHGADVAGFDISRDKFDTIRRSGARPVDASDLAAVDPAEVFPDGPPTVVVDFVGTAETARWALDGLAMGGRLVCLTTFRNRPFEITSREMVFRELSVLGSRYSHKQQVAEAADLVASGAVRPVIGEVRKPQEALEIHTALLDRTLAGRGAIDWRLA